MRELQGHALVGVVGVGTMGTGIATVAALAGHPVRLVDVSAAAANAGLEHLRQALTEMVAKHRIDEADATAALGRVHRADSLAGLAGAGLVIEAVVEDLDVKRDLLATMDAVVGREALIATNTSSLSVSDVAAGMSHPERALGLHFFNPVPTMPLVEVVAGARTEPDVLAAAVELVRAWGKTPVQSADTPGFIVNRVARPFYGEAHRLLEEDAVDPVTLDAILREGGGFPMGPIELADLIGQDVNFSVTRSIWEQTFHDPRYTPSPLQQSWVRRGLLGRKSGHGISSSRSAPVTARVRPAPSYVVDVGGFQILDGLLERARGAGVAVRAGEPEEHEGPDSVEGWAGIEGWPGEAGRSGVHGWAGEATADWSEPDAFPGGGIVLPSGGRLVETDGETATARALSEPTVVLDWVGDVPSARRLALAPCDDCPGDVLEEALGFVQAAGLQVSIVDDVPGLVVARTWAMIANEAYDVLARGVADEADVNTAMVLGAGYPRGPLTWAAQVGARHIVAVLDALHSWYPTGRYRASSRLRRAALREETADLVGEAG